MEALLILISLNIQLDFVHKTKEPSPEFNGKF